MDIEVTDGTSAKITYAGASKWVIDSDERLHVVGEAGNMASYNRGAWACVQQLQDGAA